MNTHTDFVPHRPITARAAVVAAVGLLASCALSSPSRGTDTPDPPAVAEAFAAALARGDKPAVLALLAPSVLIYEFGGQESSRDEYAGHHMLGDMAFMANLKREQLSQQSGKDGANAWVATRNRLSGRARDKDIDLDSTETLVMIRTDAGWRIVHVHWSSAPHRSATP